MPRLLVVAKVARRILTAMFAVVRLVSLAATVSLALSSRAATVTVFAAASLSDSLKEITQTYEKQGSDRIVFNFGASSTLARQVQEGAPADIFFSADEAKMDGLEGKGLIEKETRRSRLSNSLVIVVAANGGAAVSSPKDLANPGLKRIALGDPKAVPIGIYAQEYLKKLNLWVVVEPKVVATENVRAALSAVEAGNADASIVYKTDALISKQVRVAFEVPPEDSPHISYPMALVKGSKESEASRRFLDYLSSETAGKVFEKFGFRLMEGPAGR